MGKNRAGAGLNLLLMASRYVSWRTNLPMLLLLLARAIIGWLPWLWLMKIRVTGV